jgi:hypothetical protein
MPASSNAAAAAVAEVSRWKIWPPSSSGASSRCTRDVALMREQRERLLQRDRRWPALMDEDVASSKACAWT